MIGTVIEHYLVEEEIGHGGMGTVYRARHQQLGRPAAIKVLLPELSANEEMVSRIFNEARLAALIQHPGIVDVYEFGRLPSGSAFVIMEYLEGETLGARIDREGPMPVDLAMTLARQIASALGAAHGKEIIHRDLKPDNIYLCPDEEVACGLRARVLDFGIAKLSGGLDGNTHRTRTGNLMGTPIYMSPEQCRGAGKVDWRSDIYALGCILFEMVTARVPFDLEGTGEIIAAHLYSEPPRPSALAAAVPPWLDAVILRALAKKPEDRPQTMEQLVTELGGRTRSMPPVTQPPLPPSERPPRLNTTFRSSVGEMAPPPTSRRVLARRALRVAAAVSLAGAAGLVWMAQRGGRGAEPALEQPVPAAAPMPAPVAPVVAPPPVAPPPAPPPVVAAPVVDVEAPDAGPPPPEEVIKALGGPPPRHKPHGRKPPREPKTTDKPRRETLDPFGDP